MRSAMRERWARRQLRTRDERGAVAAIMASVIVVIVLIAAFAVDLGVQRVARRDMQTLADSVALDVSRLLDGRTTSQIKAGNATRSTFEDTLNRSVSRNVGANIGTPQSGCLASITGGTASTVTGSCVKGYLVVLSATGTYPTSNGFPVEAAAATIPTGVVVLANTRVGFAFGGMAGLTGGNVSRPSVAATEPKACFRLGSFGARINSGNSALLTGLLNSAGGGALNLSAVSYQGLAAGDINLLQLSTALGLGNPTELASTTVTTQQLAVAAATVLAQNGDTANAAILNNAATQLGGSGSVNLGQVLNVSQGGAAAASASISALDLLAGSVFIANGTSALSIPGVSTNLGLTGTGLTTSVNLIQGARLICGTPGGVPAPTGSTSQATVTVKGKLASASVPALAGNALGITASVAADSTELSVMLAGADGTLNAIKCGDATLASPEGIDVGVLSKLSAVSLKQRIALSGSITDSSALGGLLSGLLGLLGTTVRVEISGSVDVTVAPAVQATPTTKTAEIRVPPKTYGQGVSTGSGDLGLVTKTKTPVGITVKAYTKVLGIEVQQSLTVSEQNSLIDAITSTAVNAVVNPLISRINSTLITPLSNLLGIELGGADVYAVPRPNCTVPKLVG